LISQSLTPISSHVEFLTSDSPNDVQRGQAPVTTGEQNQIVTFAIEEPTDVKAFLRIGLHRIADSDSARDQFPFGMRRLFGRAVFTKISPKFLDCSDNATKSSLLVSSPSSSVSEFFTV
jgi:hypothetical protein